MRALIGLLLCASAFAALPAVASAQAPMCPGGGDMATAIAFQRQILPYLSKVTSVATGQTTGGEAVDAVRGVLGAQYARLWLDNVRLGWTVAFSPGGHDAASARAAIRDYLAARLDPSAVAYLDGTLALVPTPYTAAELDAIAAALVPHMQSHGLSSLVVGCQWSDGLRVEVGVGDAETPELRARVEALVAPHGDKVRVRYGTGWSQPAIGAPGPAPVPPAPQVQQRPTPKVREYVSITRTARCARTVSAKPKPGLDVKRVRLQIGKRVSAGSTPRLKLRSRRSTVKVTVTLTDGTQVFEDLTYRRCAA